MYTIPAPSERKPSDEMIFSYSVDTTALDDGTLIVYVVHELAFDNLTPVEARVGVSLQFEYDPASKRLTKPAACSFEGNTMLKSEFRALRDYLVNDALEEIERIHTEQGEYRYHNDLDSTLFHAPLLRELVLNDLSAELNIA